MPDGYFETGEIEQSGSQIIVVRHGLTYKEQTRGISIPRSPFKKNENVAIRRDYVRL